MSFQAQPGFLSETLCQRALSACSAHLQGTKIPVLSGEWWLLWGSSWAAGRRTRLNVLSAARRCQWMQGKDMLAPPKRLPWWDLLNIFRSCWTWIFSPKIIPTVVLSHFHMEIYLIYFFSIRYSLLWWRCLSKTFKIQSCPQLEEKMTSLKTCINKKVLIRNWDRGKSQSPVSYTLQPSLGSHAILQI